jgi:CRP-like cAMP-binding protein
LAKVARIVAAGMQVNRRAGSGRVVGYSEVIFGPWRCLELVDTIMPSVNYPKGATLLIEGEATRGLFVLISGKVKLSTCSIEGKAIILKIAEAGELIGLASTLSGKPYEVTAEVSERARVSFVPRSPFLGFLRATPEAVKRNFARPMCS